MERKPKQTSYDEVPYESQAFPQSHPDRLATLGRLFGLSPSPIARCRVLELGCAGGGNLIPMAYQMPDSEFVGVDLSKRHVEIGQRVMQDLELHNIRIEHANIMEVNSSWGMFDYIICHGVFSWVPDEVQDKILAIASENLVRQGIAYVSYNTYPGWHMREMIRHMMLYHADQFVDIKERIEQARALLQFLESSVSAENNYYGLLLKKEFDLIRRSQDWYLFHEHLEEINSPLYFYQFIERAQKFGLQYLAEANFGTMLTSGFAEKVAQTLKRISRDIINSEQYMDFLRNRTFRQTLLCHNEVPLKRDLGAEDMEGLLVASAAIPEPELVDFRPGKKHLFKTPSGSKAETDYPLTKAALTVLKNQWPKAIEINTLVEEATRRLRTSSALSDADAHQRTSVLLEDMLKCYTADVVELHTRQADFVTAVGKKPEASRLAVYLANHGTFVVNQRHESVKLDAVSKELVKVLDGNHDYDELLNNLIECAADSKLVLHEGGQKITAPEKVKNALQAAMHESLSHLAYSALLVG